MKKSLLAYCLSCLSMTTFSQDSTLLKMLDDSLASHSTVTKVSSIFKATQIINTPTVEAPPKGGLQFLIMHRFGKINEGAYSLFGLDNASIRFGLDYGISNRLSVGIGRSSLDKVYDASFKWKIMQQSVGKFPFSISLYELLAHTTLRYADKPYLTARYRTSYQSSLLMARKFSSRLSLQFTPSLLHYNLVTAADDKNTVFTYGLGGRFKLTKRMSLNAEYSHFNSSNFRSSQMYRSLSFGMDLETGGHVFQLIFTNSSGMIGPYFLGKTAGNWGNGDIYFGFNISRAFNLKKDR